ncbi:reverse transcriptase [Gossypium australe]|uniref:Reverse transcriptase n=1 Tax=Gossypium australe TaxID=47621 RepID=A0A5B6X0W3_9ROSI|nr:reverse transcriptase [Gossypium australe]
MPIHDLPLGFISETIAQQLGNFIDLVNFVSIEKELVGLSLDDEEDEILQEKTDRVEFCLVGCFLTASVQIHGVLTGFFNEVLATQLGDFLGKYVEYDSLNLDRGHNDSFCQAKMALGFEVAKMEWDLSLKAQSKRAFAISSVWLREGSEGAKKGRFSMGQATERSSQKDGSHWEGMLNIDPMLGVNLERDVSVIPNGGGESSSMQGQVLMDHDSEECEMRGWEEKTQKGGREFCRGFGLHGKEELYRRPTLERGLTEEWKMCDNYIGCLEYEDGSRTSDETEKEELARGFFINCFPQTVFLMKKRVGKKGFMAVKLDMSKAYDRVEWKFIKEMMISMGFDLAWDSLVMKSMRDGLIRSAKARSGPKISDLFFEDDCIFFGETSNKGAHTLKTILREYESYSSQCVNFNKLTVVFNTNTSEGDRFLKCKVRESTFIYLEKRVGSKGTSSKGARLEGGFRRKNLHQRRCLVTKSSCKIWIGVVVRNPLGEIIASMAVGHRAIFSPFTAKAQSCVQALRLGIRMGIKLANSLAHQLDKENLENKENLYLSGGAPDFVRRKEERRRQRTLD